MIQATRRYPFLLCSMLQATTRYNPPYCKAFLSTPSQTGRNIPLYTQIPHPLPPEKLKHATATGCPSGIRSTHKGMKWFAYREQFVTEFDTRGR